MDTILNQGNFKAGSMEGATFEEYKTTSNVEGVQSSFTSSITGAQASTESLGGLQNLGNFQSTNSISETLPTITAVQETTDYQGESEKGGLSLGQIQTSSTSTQNITQTLPPKFLPLITQDINTGKVTYQSANATASSTTVDINTLQTTSSFDTNASLAGSTMNALQSSNQGETFGIPTTNSVDTMLQTTTSSSNQYTFQTTNENNFQASSTIDNSVNFDANANALTSGATANLETQASNVVTNTNFDITSFQNTQSNVDNGVSLDNFQITNTTENTIPTGLDTGAFQASIPIESSSSLDLKNFQTTTSVDTSSNTQAFDVNALQTATPNLETSSTLQTTGSFDLANLENRQIQTFDASSSQIEQTNLDTLKSNITPTFDINALQTTSTTNVETTTQNVDFGTTGNITTTPSFDLNAMATTSTTETQNFDINAFQTT